MTRYYNIFDTNRFKNLICLTISQHWKRGLILLSALFITTFLGSIIIAAFARNIIPETPSIRLDFLEMFFNALTKKEISGFLAFLLSLAGAFLIIPFVKDVSRKNPKASNFLLLPVSPLERIAASLLIGSLCYYIISVITIIIAVNLGMFIALYGSSAYHFTYINIFNQFFIKGFLYLLITQGIFTAGTFFFRKNIFILCILSYYALAFVYNIFEIIFNLSFKHIFNFNTKLDTIVGYHANYMECSSDFLLLYLVNPTLGEIISITTSICCVTAFWGFTYYKLKEKELR